MDARFRGHDKSTNGDSRSLFHVIPAEAGIHFFIPTQAGIQKPGGHTATSGIARNSEGLFQNLVHGFLAAVELIFHRFFE